MTTQTSEQIQVGGTEPVTALAVVATLTPMQLFAPGSLNPIIEQIKAQVRAIETDISTDAGRKAIKSLVHKIARSKTFIDAQRQALVGDRKKEIALVDAEGKRAWDELEALQDEVRKPLTDWENAEEAKADENEHRISLMLLYGQTVFTTLPAIDAAGRDVDKLWDHSFELFTKRASAAKEKADLQLKSERERITKEVAERVERDRIRREADEKARVERENKIAEEARLKAEAEATRLREAEAAAAKQREQDLLRTAAEEKARHEREKVEAEQRLQKSIADAKERERKAEADRVAAQVQAQADRVAARERAEAEREQAVSAERKRNDDIRLAEEQKRDAAAREKATREADQAHRQTVLKNAHAALIAQVSELTSPIARAVIVAISKGMIPGVSVNY